MRTRLGGRLVEPASESQRSHPHLPVLGSDGCSASQVFEVGPPFPTSHERRRAVNAHESREHLDEVAGANAAGDVDGEALPRPLVDDGEAFELLAVRARVEDKVERPKRDSVRRVPSVADDSTQRDDAGACEALADARCATVGARDRRSCDGRHVPGKRALHARRSGSFQRLRAWATCIRRPAARCGKNDPVAVESARTRVP